MSPALPAPANATARARAADTRSSSTECRRLTGTARAATPRSRGFAAGEPWWWARRCATSKLAVKDAARERFSDDDPVAHVAMAIRLSACGMLCALLGGCGSSAAPHPSRSDGSPRLTFGYDAALPLQYVNRGRINRRTDPIAVDDVSFRSERQRIEGYLLLPPSRVRRPAVVFVHGTGGDRGELLERARWLAGRNVVTLTISEPSTFLLARAGGGAAAVLKQIQAAQVRDVVAVRRAVDLLRSLPQVDPRRIGYLGWSAGARTGTLVAASEPRVKALVLLSAGAAPIAAYVANAPPNLRRGAASSRQHRSHPLHRDGPPRERPARGWVKRPDGSASRAAEHRPSRAKWDDSALVRRTARTRQRGVPRRLRLAGTQAPDQRSRRRARLACPRCPTTQRLLSVRTRCSLRGSASTPFVPDRNGSSTRSSRAGRRSPCFRRERGRASATSCGHCSSKG